LHFLLFPEEELIISSCKTNIFGEKKYDSRFLCNFLGMYVENLY
jgi:hypothetical protein